MRLQRIRQPRQVALHQLALERERGRGDDHRRVVGLRVAHRGHEVGERLARAGAGLDGEVALRIQRLRYCLRHAVLALAARAAKGFNRGVQKLSGCPA